MQRSVIRLLTCGSVDDGKSTLIGRLLVETDSIAHDTIDSTRNVRFNNFLNKMLELIKNRSSCLIKMIEKFQSWSPSSVNVIHFHHFLLEVKHFTKRKENEDDWQIQRNSLNVITLVYK